MKKFLPQLFTLTIISAILLASCGTEGINADENLSAEPIPNPVKTLLPIDWETEVSNEELTIFHANIENPSSDALLSTYLVIPNTNEDSYPTVFLVPGGSDYGSKAFDNPKTSSFYIENEIAFAYFDPDGRGESSGEEDVNGEIHQDGLFAVSQAVAAHPKTDTDEMGIVSYSFGTSMVSGMLARYPNQTSYEWYIDWEGPSAREYITVGCENSAFQPLNELLKIDCSDDDFWEQRESVNFLPKITIPYLRIQSEKDHVQDSNEHAIDAINAATGGSSPWTRVNNEHINQTYTYSNPPEYLPKSQKAAATQGYILEMFGLF